MNSKTNIFTKHSFNLWFLYTSMLLFPLLIWFQQVGSILIYFQEGVPEGQLIYVLSKLTGMLALFSIAWQIIVTLCKKLNILTFNWTLKSHKRMGYLILFFALAHMLLFVIAVSLRQGYPAWGLFMPNFKDYYHTRLTLGLIGMGLLIFVSFIGVLRLKLPKIKMSYLHRAYWLSILSIYFHSLAIGSDVQAPLAFLFYAFLGLIIVILGISYGVSNFKIRQLKQA